MSRRTSAFSLASRTAAVFDAFSRAFFVAGAEDAAAPGTVRAGEANVEAEREVVFVPGRCVSNHSCSMVSDDAALRRRKAMECLQNAREDEDWPTDSHEPAA